MVYEKNSVVGNSTGFILNVLSAINNFIDLGKGISDNYYTRLKYADALNNNNAEEIKKQRDSLDQSNKLVGATYIRSLS
jgi:hypothetical protein